MFTLIITLFSFLFSQLYDLVLRVILDLASPTLPLIAYGVGSICALLVIYQISSYVRAASKLSIAIVGVSFITIATRAIIIATPILWDAMVNHAHHRMTSFDSGVLSLTHSLSSTLISENNQSSPSYHSNPLIGWILIITITIVSYICYRFVVARAWLGALATGSSTGAVTTRECTSYDKKAESSSAESPMCAPASTESLLSMFQALLPRKETSPKIHEDSGFNEILNHRLTDMRNELITMIRQELATLTTTLTLTLPTSSSIADMIMENENADRMPFEKSGVWATSRNTTATPPNTLTTTFNYDSSDDSYGCSDEELDYSPLTAAGFVSRKRINKIADRKIVNKPIAQKEALDVSRPAQELTEAELKQLLQTKQAENRPPQYLTEEEKEMDLSELHRKWKLEGQQRRQERAKLSPFDFEPLGKLNEEQKNWTRGQIRRLLSDKKYETWIRSMKEQNIPLKECEVCHELSTDTHQCIATRWFKDGAQGTRKAVVITQTAPGNISLREKEIIDAESLKKEYEGIGNILKQVEERHQKIQSLLQPSSSVTDDVEMQASSSNGNAQAPSTPTITVIPPRKEGPLSFRG
jgi:hypothetical protein